MRRNQRTTRIEPSVYEPEAPRKRPDPTQPYPDPNEPDSDRGFSSQGNPRTVCDNESSTHGSKTMIEEVITKQYRATDGTLYPTKAEAEHASIVDALTTLSNNVETGDYDRDNNPVSFVADNVDAIKAIIAPELDTIKQALDQYEQDLKDRKHGGVAADNCLNAIKRAVGR